MKLTSPAFYIVDRKATIGRFAHGKSRKAKPYGVYVTPDQLGWNTLSFEELIDICRSVHAANTIHLLAGFNLMLESGGLGDDYCQVELAKTFFSDDDLRTIAAFADQFDRFVWVCPLQFRLLISLLIQHGTNEATGSLADRATCLKFGKALVSSAVSLTKKLPPYLLDGPLRKLPLELENSHAGFRADLRGVEQISVKGFILEKLLTDTGVREAITTDLGYTPTEFQTALTALWSHYYSLKPQHLLQAGSLSIGFEYVMGQSRIPKIVGDEILKQFCIDFDHLPTSESRDMPVNMATLAERPFGVFQGSIICLDLDFVLARMGRELWNLASRVAKIHEIPEFHADAGYAFEDYCEIHLSKITQVRTPRGAVLFSEDQLGAATLDFLYIEGDTALAIECKTAPLPTTILYGTDPESLAQAIREKYVTGTKKKKYGFIQCAKHIRTMLKRPGDFGLSEVKQIIPCLIVLEDVLTCSPAYDFAVHEAIPLFAEFGNRVGMPVIIHSEDLAYIAMRAHGVSPCEVLSRLGATDIFQCGTTRKFILDEWNEAFLHNHGEVDLDRPLHYVDDAIAYLEEQYVPAPSKQCEVCQSDMVLTLRSDTSAVWWCKPCNKPSILRANHQDIKALNDHREGIIASYRSS